MPEIQSVDRIIHPRWLVTDSHARRLLEHHSLVVAQGRIVDVCPSTVARQFYQAPWVHELPHHLVVPGLINLRTQAATVLFRGLFDDPSETRLDTQRRQTLERALVSEDMVRVGVELAMAELLRGGQTCFADNYLFPDRVGDAALAAGLRCHLNVPITMQETAWSRHGEDALRRGLNTLDRFKGNHHISTGFGIDPPQTLTDSLLHKVATLAAELGAPVQMPVQCTASERAESLQRFGQTSLERLDQAGLLTPEFQAVHVTHLTEADYAVLIARGVHVIHCPISEAKRHGGLAHSQRLLDAGLNVALGTGCVADHNSLSLLEEAKFASLVGKLAATDSRALSAWTCLEMMTHYPAQILGRADLGHLNPGAEADLAAFALNQINTTPVHHPISQLLYANHGLSASDVWVGGELVLRHGRLVHIDEDAAIEAANTWMRQHVAC